MKYMKLFLFLTLAVSLGVAWIPIRSTVAQGGANFGDPLPGLNAEDRAAFYAGKIQFQQIEDPTPDGLGPIFNARSCGECHSFPTTGGGSAINEVRFGRTINGVFDSLANEGGSLLQLFATSPDCQELVPPDANRVGFRQTTPVFGAGLVEAIPDQEIRNYAALQAAHFPGQAGMVNNIISVSDGRTHVGRFGWKSQQALLLDFSGDAYVNEMGVTNELFGEENMPNTNFGQPGYPAIYNRCNPPTDNSSNPQPGTVREPNNTGDIVQFANFMRFLGAPPPLGPTAQTLHGEEVFERIGCAVCHKESFRAVSSHAGINGVTVRAFSDFLLHDIGTGDGIANGGPGTDNKFRTTPLWGLRVSAPYLHNGQAATPRQAIGAHHNQAEPSRINFNNLSAADQAAVLAFLNSI